MAHTRSLKHSDSHPPDSVRWFGVLMRNGCFHVKLYLGEMALDGYRASPFVQAVVGPTPKVKTQPGRRRLPQLSREEGRESLEWAMRGDAFCTHCSKAVSVCKCAEYVFENQHG